jgi:microcystin-dependent protein
LGTSPYIGEIVMFAGGFAPRGSAYCMGQLLPINQNQALFSILGTTYGGNGVQTFALPDLRGRIPVGVGSGGGRSPVVLGQKAGAESQTLTVNQLPAHVHTLNFPVDSGGAAPLSASTTKATLQSPPAGGVFGRAVGNPTSPLIYCPAGTSATVPLAGGGTTSSVGLGQSFGIKQPYTGIAFIIYTSGLFPSRN